MTKENNIDHDEDVALAEYLYELGKNSSAQFGIGIRDENRPNHWCETSDISFKDKKTILILPGSGANRAKEANGMCKIVQNMLPQDKIDDFQICSI